ncbi:hypothetical protein JYB87_04035 [Shewanella avicenniae]|uniref:Ankyrin repeat-containing protein n=1 Tax=Shewanella avicenniae TaxID=2814294 RepID=A0ABX7QT49_9GAMM|nr:hypothetical protein [Shewanella avicenniae]QSX34429.1 hypothetical protein JYB87_04035 [Shewanella avicenniae]
MKKWLLLLVLLVIAIVVGVWLSAVQSSSPVEFGASADSGLLSADAASSDPKKAATSVKALDTTNFAECRRFTVDKQSEEGKWFRDSYESWGSYLAQGYSLDDITAAIDHLGNSNFAESFRITQLREHSQLQQTNHQLTQSFYDELSDDETEAAESMGFSIMRVVPNPQLVQFIALPEAEKAQQVGKQEVSVDDIAALMLDPQVAETDIQALLAQVANVNATVGFEQLASTSLLDFAIFGNRGAIVKQLLDGGMPLSNDRYLGASQEWALVNLSEQMDRDDAATAKAVNIVNLLIPYGAGSRFSQHSDTLIEGSIPRWYFKFDPSDIARLQQDYGLDLTQIPPREAMPMDDDSASSALISELELQRRDYLNQTLGVTDANDAFSRCNNTLAAVEQRWKAKRAGDELYALRQQYPDNTALLLQQAATIDPLVVDLYREQTISSYPQRVVPEAHDILMSLGRDNDIDRVISKLQPLELTVPQKNYVVLQALYFDGRYYRKLADSSLFSDDVPYYTLARHQLTKPFVEQLEQGGADLTDKDDRGKTLLYYAVAAHKLELMDYLQQQGYPFDLDELHGEDPLHQVLDVSRGDFDPAKLLPMVEILMRYQPTINPFHLQRLALMKLMYPALYQQLADKSPQLQVNDATPLPNVRP